MNTRITRITTCIAALVVTAAIGAPSALASAPPRLTPAHAAVPPPTWQLNAGPNPRSVQTRSTTSAGSNWLYAIAAVTAAGACLFLTKSALDARRLHHPKSV